MGFSAQLVPRTSMGVGTALRALGRFVDECEERDVVNRVEISGTDDVEATVAATLELVVDTCAPPAESGFSPGEAAVGPDGTLSVSFESASPLLPVDDHDVDVEPVQTSTTEGGTVVELRATVPNGASAADEEAADGTSTTSTGGTATVDDSHISVSVGRSGTEADDEPAADATGSSRRSRDVPPFRDTELLQEVYDTCDTFSEMPDALGMDVTAETVRRYMIRQGIHEPTSYDTSSNDDAESESTDTTDVDEGRNRDTDAHEDETQTNEDDTDTSDGGDEADYPDETGERDREETPSQPSDELESPAVLADGIGLPDDVTIDSIVEAVQTSNTIYEVKQGIGIEREDALEMLRELNLLEFVAGRLATEAEREVSRDQIIDRLRQQADSL